MLLFTSISIAREVIVLHKARNTQILPIELSSPLPSTSTSTTVASVTLSPVKQKGNYLREDSPGFTNIDSGTNDSVIHTTPNQESSHVDENSENHEQATKNRYSPTGEARTESKNKPVREVQSTDLKAVKVLGVTASVYFIVWGPYVILVVLLSFFPYINVPAEIRFAFMWLANSNSFMNVFIYSLMYSGFRRNAALLFRNTFAQVLSWCGERDFW